MRITLILLLILCLLWAWCLPGNEVETVSMHMYNGVKLPALPEFEYEYAYIAENVAIKGWYALFVSDKAFVYDKLTNTMIRQDGSTVMRCVCTGEAWGEFVAHESDSLLSPIWANYDVLDTNGDVRLYATEPAKMWENARSFLIGLAMAFAGKPLPISQGKKEPVAYLYNGVRLPKLPEWDWDREAYPYAFIQDAIGSKYTVTFADQMPYFDGEYIKYETPTNAIWYGAEPENPVEWIYGGEMTYNPNFRIYPYFWANTDILNEDGTIFLAASDAVPVYE